MHSYIKQLFKVLVALFVTCFAVYGFAQEHAHPTEAQKKEDELNASEVLLEHISDSHEFHFADYKDIHVTAPLPIIAYSPTNGLSVFMSSKFHHGTESYKGYQLVHDKLQAVDGSKVYDFSITKNVFQMLLASTVLVILMISIAKKYRRGQGVVTAPKGIQNAIEPVVEFLRDEVAKPNIGEKWQKYMPFLLTVFFFILFNNIFGLLPGSANVTGNIAFTMVLGVVAFIAMLFSTNKHFWGHILWPPGVPVFVKPMLTIIELLGFLVIKPAALMIRLFANMVAGHIVILSFILLIFIFGAMNKWAGLGFSIISVAFAVFIYLIEILVAFIQAFIFTNLTSVFISQSMEEVHEVSHEGEHSDSHSNHATSKHTQVQPAVAAAH